MVNKEYDIHERIFNFVIDVISFLDKLPKTSKNHIFIGQCTRAATSMGANDQEVDGALTRKDFMHCFTVVRKEAKETVYWIRLIGRINKRFNFDAELLIREGNEIVAIVSKIIINAGENKKERI